MAKPRSTAFDLYEQLGHEHGEGLFDLLPDVQFWIKDLALRYVRVNQALLHNYGFSEASSMVGKTDHDLMPPHLAEQYLRDDVAVLDGQVIHHRIELVARPDHSTGWHITDKIPLRSRSGRIIATAGITRDLDASEVANTTHGTLGPVVDHLRAHFSEPIDRHYLAHLLRRSVRSVERQFRSAFGISLLQYQRKLRMHRACELLIGSDQPLTTIAYELGYSDHSHFTREFHRWHALTPHAYRQRWHRRVSL